MSSWEERRRLVDVAATETDVVVEVGENGSRELLLT